MSLLLLRAGFFINVKNETNTKYKLVVVAQQLFTTVKRGNAIAIKSRKTAHRITVGRFFCGLSRPLQRRGERKRKNKK